MTTKIYSSNLGPNLIFPGLPSIGTPPAYTDNSAACASTSFVQTLLSNYTANIFLNQVKVGAGGAGNGWIGIDKGGTGTSGLVSLYGPNNIRQGYVQSISNIGTGDQGSISYVSASHLFTGSITASGNITAYSDARLKSNVLTLVNALDKVSKLRGVSFDKDGEHGIGVIAQEVQKVIPEVVMEGVYLSVAYGNLIGLLIEAIKELKIEVDDLKGLK